MSDKNSITLTSPPSADFTLSSLREQSDRWISFHNVNLNPHETDRRGRRSLQYLITFRLNSARKPTETCRGGFHIRP